MKKEDRRPARGGEGADPAKSAEPSFEAAITRLNEIVEKLESGELPLEESLRLFEEGVALSRRAGELLDQAERKVEILTRTAGNDLEPEPFEDESDDRE